jgi:hypothetical protein
VAFRAIAEREEWTLSTIKFATLFLFLGAFGSSYAQTLSKVRIGDDVSRITAMNKPPSAAEPYKDFIARKWNFA